MSCNPFDIQKRCIIFQAPETLHTRNPPPQTILLVRAIMKVGPEVDMTGMPPGMTGTTGMVRHLSTLRLFLSDTLLGCTQGLCCNVVILI
jgi:hypothetical protein